MTPRPNFTGYLVLAAFVAVFLLGCASGQLRPCTGAENVALDCKAEQVRRGCADEPERLCPELVRECDARIDAMTDDEVCP